MKTQKLKIAQVVPALLLWFARNARDLPWRRLRDPYGIWVSEIMLQQTQVKTVIPYFERWMRELPDIASVAGCTPEKIHKLWEGLGYYTRARNLQKAAQIIVDKHGGVFPDAFDRILALPGIGRYTAGAISSIAFDQPAPILDGNVTRVLTRIFGIAENPLAKTTNARLWELASALVGEAARNPFPTCRCSQLNESLMELGALVCSPRAPDCGVCPLRKYCVAFRENRTRQLPNLPRRVPATRRRFLALVLEDRQCVLVQKRPAGILNAHLWEFPNLEVDPGQENLATLVGKTWPLSVRSVAKLCTIKHSITRYRITLEAYHAKTTPRAICMRAPGAMDLPASQRWLSLKKVNALALTSAHRKILNHFLHFKGRAQGTLI